MPPSSNKYLQLLDQGLSAFVFERDESDKPVLSDNSLMVAPCRDELEDYIESTEPSLHTFIKTGLLMDTSGGTIIFSSLAQATDYYRGNMPMDFSYKNPATSTYNRPAAVTAAYASSTVAAD